MHEALDLEAYLFAQELLCALLTLGLVAVCCCILSQLLSLRALLRSERAVRFGVRPGLGLPEENLQALLAQSAPPSVDGSECSVCLQEISSSAASLQLDCCPQHYHRDCLVQWLAVVARCPLCRSAVTL